MHPLVDQLLALVPPSGAPWPRASRERWVTALGAVLDVIYEDGSLSPVAPEPSRPEPAPARQAWEGPLEQRTPEEQPPTAATSPTEDERVPPPWYSTDWSVLDLTDGLPHETSEPGRHVRRSTPYD